MCREAVEGIEFGDGLIDALEEDVVPDLFPLLGQDALHRHVLALPLTAENFAEPAAT